MAFKTYAECTHQCAIFDGEELVSELNSFERCINDHSKYLTVDEFHMGLLPESFRKREYADFIRNAIDRTVRVVTSVTSVSRPDTYPMTDKAYPFSNIRGNNKLRRSGTGYLLQQNPGFSLTPCPCWLCKQSKEPKTHHSYFYLDTATHVIFDELEIQNARFELFYETEDRQGVEFLYGVGLEETIPPFSITERMKTDRCTLTCVSHDPQLTQRLIKLIGYQWPSSIEMSPLPILISHPDGCRKRISIGDFRKMKYISDILSFPVGHIILNEKTLLRFWDDNDCIRDAPPNLVNSTLIPVRNYAHSRCYEFKRSAIFVLPDTYQVSFSNHQKPKCPFSTLPAGTEIQTMDEQRFKCPYSMEIVSFPENVLINDGVMSFLYYDMASCPGSSGARIFSSSKPLHHSLAHGHHFGVTGRQKMTGYFRMRQDITFL